MSFYSLLTGKRYKKKEKKKLTNFPAGMFLDLIGT